MNAPSLLLLREVRGPSRARAVSMLDTVLPASEIAALAPEARVFVVMDVACDSDHAQACAWVSGRRAAEIELHALVVDPAYRRRGVGRYLIHALADRCRSEGAHHIFATVQSVATGRLLTTCGFTASPTGDRAAGGSVCLRLAL